MAGDARQEPQTDREVNQHSSDSIAFKEHYQCPDELYIRLQQRAESYLRENTEWDEKVDLSQIELRRFTFEDGVISFDATHPHVTHEDEMDGEIPVEDFQEVDS